MKAPLAKQPDWDWGWKGFYSSRFPLTPVKLQKAQSLQKGRVTLHAASFPWGRMECSYHLGFFWQSVIAVTSAFFPSLCLGFLLFCHKAVDRIMRKIPFWKAESHSCQTVISTVILVSCTSFSCLNILWKACSFGEQRVHEDLAVKNCSFDQVQRHVYVHAMIN